jgi:hypothetical protein
MPCTPRITHTPHQVVLNDFVICRRLRFNGRRVTREVGPVDWNKLNLLPGLSSCVVILLAWSINKRPVGWSIPEVEIRSSPVSGKGVFARRRIEEGTTIGRFGGVLRTPNEVQCS